MLPWLVAGALAVALAWVEGRYQRAVGTLPSEPAQLFIHPAEGVRNSSFALSPDGRYLAVAPVSTNRPMLWVHSLVTGETRALPDGRRPRPSVLEAGQPGDRLLRRHSAEDRGVAGWSTDCRLNCWPDGPIGSGSWSQSNVIVVGAGSTRQPIQKVGAAGTLEPATVLGNGEVLHASPAFLPDGVHFLYVVRRQGNEQLELRVGSLESKAFVESLGPVESSAVYADGHLFFVRGGHIGGGSLAAWPFDPVRRRATGDAVALGLPVAAYSLTGAGAFSVGAESNRLVYVSSTASLSDLIWYNRSGVKLGIVGEPGLYMHLDISPDDQRVAVTRQTQEPGRLGSIDIWTIDLKPGGGATRVTDDPANELDPAWSGDGRHVAFNSNKQDGSRATSYGLFIRPSDGTGKDVRLVTPVQRVSAPDWVSGQQTHRLRG